MITITQTRNQVLPIYGSLADQHYRACGSHTGLIFPSYTDISDIQIVTETATSLSGFFLNHVDGDYRFPYTPSITSSSYDIDGDGVDEVITEVSGFGGLLPSGRAGYHYISFQQDGKEKYTEAFLIDCDITHTLTWSGCDNSGIYYGGGFENKLYLNIDFRSPEYEISIDGEENADGDAINIRHKRLKYYSFNLITPDFLLDALTSIAGHDTITLQRAETGEIWNLTDVSLALAGAELSCERYSTLKFRVVEESLTKTACCNNLITATPTPAETCHSFTIDIDPVAETATYTVTNDPNNAPAYSPTWYYRETPTSTAVLVGTVDTIALVGSGIYELVLSSSFCTAKESVTYGTIENLNLIVEVNADTLSSTLEGCSGSVTWDVQNSAGTTVATTPVYTATVSDYYTVYATCDATGTTVNKTVYIDIAVTGVCTHTPSISRTDLTLTGTTTNYSGVLSETWDFEDQDGTTFGIANGNTAPITANGVYWYNSDVDGCVIRTYIVVTDYCLPVSICNPSEIQTNVTVNTENVTCP